MVRVVIVLRTSLVAVPAFMRVLPARASGPVKTRMERSAESGASLAGTHAKKTVLAPAARAAFRAE